MIGSSSSIAVFVLFFLFVPGLPLAYHVARRCGDWSLVLPLSPLFSIGLSFVIVSFVNFVGVRLPLGLVAYSAVIVTSVFFFVRIKPQTTELKQIGKEIAHVVPAAIVGFIVWSKAYSDTLFLAPNQDALNHNKWIARIVQVDSFLPRDSYVGSPLQGIGKGTGFYPLAWHSQVATSVEISHLVVPVASLLSLVIVWTICLPAALRALSKVWVPRLGALGAIAGVLVQVYPLAPGVPLSWGSMTSVLGIGLLPAAFVLGVISARSRDRLLVASSLFAALALFFVHTPEAASLMVLMVSIVLVDRGSFKRPKLKYVVLVVLVFALPVLIIFRKVILSDINSLRSLFGAPQPKWELALGQFFALNVNIPSNYTVLALLFVAGLVLSSYERSQQWLVACVLGLGMVYLISGAPDGPLSTLRLLTAPWYASYERTAWVVVPFAALISSYPIASLMEVDRQRTLARFLIAQALALALFVQVVREQTPLAISQLRSGSEVAALLGKEDLEVIDAIRDEVGDGEIALSWTEDGSTYPFMYEQILVSAGAFLDRNGDESDRMRSIYQNIGDLCGNPDALQAMESEKVSVVVFGTTAAWGSSIWTASEVRRLGGLEVLAIGEKLIATKPDPNTCP